APLRRPRPPRGLPVVLGDPPPARLAAAAAGRADRRGARRRRAPGPVRDPPAPRRRPDADRRAAVPARPHLARPALPPSEDPRRRRARGAAGTRRLPRPPARDL